jgi:hypothetical protein
LTIANIASKSSAFLFRITIDSLHAAQRRGERRAKAVIKAGTPLAARPFDLELDLITFCLKDESNSRAAQELTFPT